MERSKRVRITLAMHFKLSKKQSPIEAIRKKFMAVIHYVIAVGSLMFDMLCTGPNIS